MMMNPTTARIPSNFGPVNGPIGAPPPGAPRTPGTPGGPRPGAPFTPGTPGGPPAPFGRDGYTPGGRGNGSGMQLPGFQEASNQTYTQDSVQFTSL